jgi:hypothetical protein
MMVEFVTVMVARRCDCLHWLTAGLVFFIFLKDRV